MWSSNLSVLRGSLTGTFTTILRNYSTRGTETHYDVLKVPRNCTNKQIKDAFIKLSKEYHPDRNKNKESQERFVKISNAYSVLSKPESRRNYDLGLPRFGDFHHKYHEVPFSRNPYDDPFLYRNRDKSQDNFYKRQPYYGVGGIEKLPNRIVALFCILIAGFGLFLQILAIRHSLTFRRDQLARKSNEAIEELQKVKNRREINGHDMQVQLLEKRFRDGGLLNDDK